MTIASISTKIVCNSSYVRVQRPTTRFKGRLTLRTNRSQKPPHQGARSTINCHFTRLSTRYLHTSCDRIIFPMSLLDDLKALALSDVIVAGNPRRLENRLNASRNACTLTPRVSSRWTALVDAQVKSNT